MDLTVGYVNPDDIPDGALIYCFDLAYWKGDSTSNWQRLSPPSSANNSGAGSNCGERNVNFNEATYSPNATVESTEAYNIAGTITLSNSNLGLSQNNRILLADVVIGQQGPNTIHFYSAKSGDWTDPSTWFTDSYSSGINSTGSFPKERLHIAHIGEGHKVTLNANIGNSYPDTEGTEEFREQRLGSVLLEKTTNGVGYLSLGTYVIRASVFQMQEGCIIETGAEDGFHASPTRGNIIQQYNSVPIARDFNYNTHNKGNFIFNPVGRISTTYLNSDQRYCQDGLGTGGRVYYKSRISRKWTRLF
ncbi:hypothetical protein MASR1M45_16120 [Candidatus Kapaibacterium sp.]